MKRKQKILSRNYFPAINADRQKFTVVNFTVMAVVDVLEQGLYLRLVHVCVFKSKFNVIHLQGA
jgi:hypothetical protein